MPSIKENLKKKMREQDLTTSKLSEISGEKFTYIKSVLNGRTQNPGALSLLAIAKSLNCSVEELLTGDPSATTNEHKDLPIENYKLFLESSIMVAAQIEKSGLIIKQSEFISSCNEVYLYALKKKWKEVDPDFVEWYINKSL